mgnify:CR=1 FL=1
MRAQEKLMKINRKEKTVRASCHCGSIQLKLFLKKGLKPIIRCNCSMCSRNKGFGMICIPLSDILVVKGFESMTEYIFKSQTSPHVFCILCGVHTHHKSRRKPDNLCINVACIEGLNVNDYGNEVISFDGINHPMDN